MDAQNLKEPISTFPQPSKQEATPPKAQVLSPISSPTHEFSFTITLHPFPISAPSPTFTPSNHSSLDCSPADDIFIHGHLLSHPPRPLVDQNLNHPCITHNRWNNNNNNSSSNNNNNSRKKKKSNSFSSLFRRKVFELKHIILKKYAEVIRPILFPRGEKVRREVITRRPHSFSASSLSSAKGRERWATRRRGEFSAPASMGTSPTNSGLLLATPVAGMSSKSSESSMEELQSAIQAAIAHCKGSTAATKETRPV